MANDKNKTQAEEDAEDPSKAPAPGDQPVDLNQPAVTSTPVYNMSDEELARLSATPEDKKAAKKAAQKRAGL